MSRPTVSAPWGAKAGRFARGAHGLMVLTGAARQPILAWREGVVGRQPAGPGR